MISHLFQLFVGVCIFDYLCSFYLMYPTSGTFDNVILILQPGKEAGENASDIVYGDPAGLPGALILRQITAQIRCCDLLRRFSEGAHHGFNGLPVIL